MLDFPYNKNIFFQEDKKNFDKVLISIFVKVKKMLTLDSI